MENEKPIRSRIPERKREVVRGLISAGESYRKVAETLGISVGSVHNIMLENPAEIEAVFEQIKNTFIQKLYLLADYCLGRISEQDIFNAGLKDKIISASILIDKARLMEGLATQNIATIGKPSPEEAGAVIERIKELEKKLAEFMKPKEISG